jgi:hypothetical protein
MTAIVFQILPRLLIAGLWFLSSWFHNVFATWWWPLLGFLCMPFTMLWFSAVKNWYGGTWGFLQISILILAIAMDVGPEFYKRGKRKC